MSGFKVSVIKDVDAAKFRKLKASVKSLGDTQCKVGLPSKVGMQEENGVTLALIGAANEFGVPDKGIPERSWLRGGLRWAKEKLIRLNRINLVKIIQGDMTIEVAYNQLGNLAAGLVKKYFRAGEFVPNAASTIARKGSSQPLIDIGTLRQSVTYEIGPAEKVTK